MKYQTTLYCLILLLLCNSNCTNTKDHQKCETVKDDNGILKICGIDKVDACYTLYSTSEVLIAEYCLVDSLYDGRMVIYHENGNPKYIKHFLKGILYGMDTSFYENGVIRYIYEIVMDKKNGASSLFDETGRLLKYAEFKNDSMYFSETFLYENTLDTILHYDPLIWLSKDTFNSGDTLVITFELPITDMKQPYDSAHVIYNLFEISEKEDIPLYEPFDYINFDSLPKAKKIHVEVYSHGEYYVEAYLRLFKNDSIYINYQPRRVPFICL